MLVVIEGIDKSGKDTLAHGLVDALSVGRPARHKPLLLVEPADKDGLGGAGAPGVMVRRHLRAKTRGESPAGWLPEAWICAFVGAMLAQDGEAHEALVAGRDVIYVRRVLSTLAYQCFASDRVADLVPFVLAATKSLADADLTILLDGAPETFSARGAGERRDNAANESLDAQRRLRRAYLDAIQDRRTKPMLGRIVVIDAEQPVKQVLVKAVTAVTTMRG